MAEGGLGGQMVRPGLSAGSLGPKWVGEMLALLPSDPLPSQQCPLFPLRAWEPFPAASQGCWSCSPPLLPTNPNQSLGVPPIPLSVRGPPPVP